jgi:hypothetical protein
MDEDAQEGGAVYRLPTEAEHHVARGRVSALAGDDASERSGVGSTGRRTCTE